MSVIPDNPGIWSTRAVRAGFQRASATFAGAAVVHGEARARLLDRLDWVKLSPALIVDAGCGQGEAAAGLAHRYPRARVLAVDSSPAMLGQVRATPERTDLLAADASRLPLPADSVDLLFANLLLPWITDLPGLFAELAAVLETRRTGAVQHGRAGYPLRAGQGLAGGGRRAHIHGFYDMHDVGDALTRSGLAEPVLDVDHLTVTYPSLTALCRESKACGAGNAAVGRRRGLTGRQRWRRMAAAYPLEPGSSPVHATVELIFGQAWGAAPRRAAEPGVTAVPVSDIKRRR